MRERKKISQQYLATTLNMSQNTISQYETCSREASYDTMVAIADYFDVSIDYLLGRTDNPKVNR